MQCNLSFYIYSLLPKRLKGDMFTHPIVELGILLQWAIMYTWITYPSSVIKNQLNQNFHSIL